MEEKPLFQESGQVFWCDLSEGRLGLLQCRRTHLYCLPHPSSSPPVSGRAWPLCLSGQMWWPKGFPLGEVLVGHWPVTRGCALSSQAAGSLGMGQRKDFVPTSALAKGTLSGKCHRDPEQPACWFRIPKLRPCPPARKKRRSWDSGLLGRWLQGTGPSKISKMRS